jgi:hypothetical protein
MSGRDQADSPAHGSAPLPGSPTGSPPVGLGSLRDFELERFFDRFEFDLPFQMGSSDPETLSVSELLDHAGRRLRSRWAKLRLGYRTAAGDPEGAASPPGPAPAVDLSKPLPPDASDALKQAYERARQELERQRQGR